MKELASIVFMLMCTASLSFAGSWTGRLVDAVCKASSDGTTPSWTCSATADTHLFAIELADSKVLNLDAIGNTKVAATLKNPQKTDLHATVTGSLQGQTVKVESIEIQK